MLWDRVTFLRRIAGRLHQYLTISASRDDGFPRENEGNEREKLCTLRHVAHLGGHADMFHLRSRERRSYFTGCGSKGLGSKEA